MYLLVFIDDVCRNALVNHFGENGWSCVAVLLGSLLCQFHLIALGAQPSLGASLRVDTQTGDVNTNQPGIEDSCSTQKHNTPAKK